MKQLKISQNRMHIGSWHLHLVSTTEDAACGIAQSAVYKGLIKDFTLHCMHPRIYVTYTVFTQKNKSQHVQSVMNKNDL